MPRSKVPLYIAQKVDTVKDRSAFLNQKRGYQKDPHSSVFPGVSDFLRNFIGQVGSYSVYYLCRLPVTEENPLR